MAHAYRDTAPALAATLPLTGGAVAQSLHPVDTMLTILMDASSSTTDKSCGGQTHYGDGKLDQSDLDVLLAAYDSRPGDDHWNSVASLSGNDHVHQEDLGIVLANFGCGTKVAP